MKEKPRLACTPFRCSHVSCQPGFWPLHVACHRFLPTLSETSQAFKRLMLSCTLLGEASLPSGMKAAHRRAMAQQQQPTVHSRLNQQQLAATLQLVPSHHVQGFCCCGSAGQPLGCVDSRVRPSGSKCSKRTVQHACQSLWDSYDGMRLK